MCPSSEPTRLHKIVLTCTKTHHFTQKVQEFSGEGARPPPETLFTWGGDTSSQTPPLKCPHYNYIWLRRWFISRITR